MVIDYYRPLFTIACRHDFYEDGLCLGLTVEPTVECQRLLSRHRLLWKATENGVLVIGENQRTDLADLALRVSIAENTRFNFVLKLKNPYFFNITQVNQNFVQPNFAFIFTASETATPAEDGTVSIHDGALSNEVITDNLMIVVDKVFQFPIAQSLDMVRVAVEDEDEQELFALNVQPTDSSVTIDLQGFAEGIYQLRSFDSTATEISLTRVFSSASRMTSQLFGFVQIPYVSSLEEPIYTLNFANRQINWQYEIEVREIAAEHPNNLELDNIELIFASNTFNPAVSFNKEVDVAARKVSFVSNQRIPLRQQPYTGIQLSYAADEDGNSEILIPNMPNPTVSRLRQDETSSADLKAQMSLKIK